MLEYDVNGYHVKVNRMYMIVDGKEVDIDLTPVHFEFAVTEEEIRGGKGTYKPKFKHVENANKELKWKKDDIK